ncbi:MAG TPA: tetratricopeptide repeat protein, partial [Gemmatimonadales bacterium]|nr:tetratricopeptide repeat protein [Gemmatimonadales bacterium]
TGDAFRARDPQLVVPALLAYAHYLEEELLLNEAGDVLETVLRVGGDALRPSDRLSGRLRVARVLRKLNQFDAAEEAYDQAKHLATMTGDRHSELLSRIGRANTVLNRGNLTDAERLLEQALLDSQMAGDREAEARAHQVMSVALVTRGQPIEAIPHVWRAFELYEDDVSRYRALGDLGGMLLMVGDVHGAERALLLVLQRAGEQDVGTNALIELMHCAASRGDRVGFERWRERCEVRRDRMPPNILADFMLKIGVGRARFGQFERAEILLATALSIAEAAHLHEAAFRIERIKKGLRDCQQVCDVTPEAVAEPPCTHDAVREVSAALAHLGT